MPNITQRVSVKIRIQTQGPLCRPCLCQSGTERGGSRINSLTTPRSILPAPPKQRLRAQSPAWHHPVPPTQTGLPGTKQGRRDQGRSGGRHRGDPPPRHSHSQDSGGCLASAASALQSHKADAIGRGSAAGGHLPLCASARPHPRSSAFHPQGLQPSVLIHTPRPCPASIICKNLKMAYFRQGRLLGMAVLKTEGGRCPPQPRLPTPRLWPALLPSCSQPCTGGLAAAERKDCYL